MDCGPVMPTLKCNANPTKSKCINCAMKTYPTFSVAIVEAIPKRVHAITWLRNKEIFLKILDAPREDQEIRRRIIEKLVPAACDYKPFLNHEYNRRTLLHRSVKLVKLDIADLLLYYGVDPDTEEDGETVTHRVAAEKPKLLLRILRNHKWKFLAYNSLGETPLMVAIAYGNVDVANHL